MRGKRKNMNLKKLYNFIKYYLTSKTYPEINGDEIENRIKIGFKYGGKNVLNAVNTNKLLYNAILSDKPYMAGRYGSSELYMLTADDFRMKYHYDIRFNILCNNAGFFPNKKEYAHKFSELMKESSKECSLFACWYNMFEEYYMKEVMPDDMEATFLFNLEPWTCPDRPWTAALKGKRVLVIHPFEKSIKKQYKNREKIFPGTNILPEFDLITIKSVQTIAGEQDTRFEDWFDALNWMYEEAMKVEFDVAIIGCGAYGFPLAAMLKKSGKKAIHLGGATQLLFGIKGNRWEEDTFSYVNKYFNEYWINPDESERPKKADNIEGACYW